MDWVRGMEYTGFHLRVTGSNLTVVISGQTPLSSAGCLSRAAKEWEIQRLYSAPAPSEPTREVKKSLPVSKPVLCCLMLHHFQVHLLLTPATSLPKSIKKISSMYKTSLAN